METSINDRINAILKELKYKSARAFAAKIGISQTSFNDILKGAEPKFTTLNKIIVAEPFISAKWLLTGDGEMLLSESPSQDSPIIEDSNSFYERMIDKKDKRIEELALLVGNLQKEVEMLKRDKKIAPEMGGALGVAERMKPTGTEDR